MIWISLKNIRSIKSSWFDWLIKQQVMGKKKNKEKRRKKKKMKKKDEAK